MSAFLMRQLVRADANPMAGKNLPSRSISTHRERASSGDSRKCGINFGPRTLTTCDPFSTSCPLVPVTGSPLVAQLRR